MLKSSEVFPHGRKTLLDCQNGKVCHRWARKQQQAAQESLGWKAACCRSSDRLPRGSPLSSGQAGWPQQAAHLKRTEQQEGRSLYFCSGLLLSVFVQVHLWLHSSTMTAWILKLLPDYDIWEKKNTEPQIGLLRYLYHHKTLLKSVQKTALLIVQLSKRSRTHARLFTAFTLSGVSTRCPSSHARSRSNTLWKQDVHKRCFACTFPTYTFKEHLGKGREWVQAQSFTQPAKQTHSNTRTQQPDYVLSAAAWPEGTAKKPCRKHKLEANCLISYCFCV